MPKLVCTLMLVLAICACSRSENHLSVAPRSVSMAPVIEAKAPTSAENGSGQAAVQRHIELHHDIDVEVPAGKLEDLWQAQLTACQPPACEVVSASVNNREHATTATLSLRIVPARAEGLASALEQAGHVIRHEMRQTDRTNEVVDYQARLANQKALRDRLRAMAAGRINKVSDLLDVERELARVQGEIDSLEGQIRATLAVTEKVGFEIRFLTPASISHPGTWSPVREAWNRAGEIFAGSVAVMLYVVAGGLPWLIVLWLLVLAIHRLWRRFKTSRKSVSG